MLKIFLFITLIPVFANASISPDSLKNLRTNAEKGDAEAQFNLGYMYYNGRGVPQDYAEALKWYRKAADQGDANAQCNLGNMYFWGDGTEKDYEEALKWKRKAADQGNVLAMTQIGHWYWVGKVVPRDYVTSYMWYFLLKEQGDRIGSDWCERLAEFMTTEQIAQAKALAREHASKKAHDVTINDSYIHAWGNLWFGVGLYYGSGDQKKFICQIACFLDDSLLVQYPDGNAEWKARSAIIESGSLWFVRKDDPYLSAMRWEKCD